MSRPSPIADRLETLADASAGRIAVSTQLGALGEQCLTWRELNRESAGRAGVLPGGDPDAGAPVVAFTAANDVETVLRIMACLRRNVSLLPLDPRATDGEVAHLLEVARQRYAAWFWDKGGSLISVGGPAVGQGLPACGDRAACLLGTGSSSGRQRLIARPGPAVLQPARVPNPLLAATGWRSGQRQLVAGPLHHAAPFTSCVEGLIDGNTVTLLATFDPYAALQIIEEHAIEWVELTPTHMSWMLSAMDAGQPRLNDLRSMVHTAAHCPAGVKSAWIELLGPARVFEFYTATEGIGATLVRGDEWLCRPGTVGRGFCTRIRIVGSDGFSLPPGTVGEVFMRSPGYARRARNPAAGVRHTPDGFSSVGDYGYLDDEGYLFLAARRHDMVTVGGENVYPAEVENVLMEHPSILDVAVAGLPDELFGFRLCAFVVPRPGMIVAAAEIRSYCAGRLSSHKVPHVVCSVDQVPRSWSGKLQRWKLAEMVTAMSQQARSKDGHAK